ncbi:Scr1 family TA system antitoxin-like transcriptional regulator [Streptomyces sp. NBRC 109706]|uniref:Scr1 family TA system antitoxin-like transcriptional regulator n=1 Tax=Streptomyces sp. NBRC 109706 TaxID=1550035 RepID=UPI0007836511|nr:Scr1 family TA system antitoxin-like transcriptional regulator [Streptomyces sp. NBRC 109706]
MRPAAADQWRSVAEHHSKTEESVIFPGHAVVGAYLRAFRRDRKLRLTDAARTIGASAARVCRMELGTSESKPDAVHALLKSYGLYCPRCLKTINELLAPPAARDRFVDTQPGCHTRLRACEQDANRLRYFSSYLIPPAFRTHSYTTALRASDALSAHLPWSTHHSAELATEVVGPDTPTRRYGTHLWLPTTGLTTREATLILDASVLRRTVVPPGVLAEQLRALRDAAHRGRLTLRVLPLTAGASGYPGALTEITRRSTRLYVQPAARCFHYSASGSTATSAEWCFTNSENEALSAEGSLAAIEEAAIQLAQLAERDAAASWFS